MYEYLFKLPQRLYEEVQHLGMYVAYAGSLIGAVTAITIILLNKETRKNNLERTIEKGDN